MIHFSQRDNKKVKIGDNFSWNTLGGKSYCGIVKEIDNECVYVVCSDGITRCTELSLNEMGRSSSLTLSNFSVRSSENIKFWISPEGKFFHWGAYDYSDSKRHHLNTINQFSEGLFDDDEEAKFYGWIRGGNINGQFYLEVYNIDKALEVIKNIPPRFRKADKVILQSSNYAEIPAFGGDIGLALMRYKRDVLDTQPQMSYASFKFSQRELPKLIFMNGLPGSGKSTWIKENATKDTIIVSPDELRKELLGNINDQTKNSYIWKVAKERTVEALKNNKDVILDATNLTSNNRKNFINGLPLHKLFVKRFEIDPETAYQRIQKQIQNNESRANVPKSAVTNMFRQFEEQSKPEQLEEEGFTLL